VTNTGFGKHSITADAASAGSLGQSHQSSKLRAEPIWARQHFVSCIDWPLTPAFCAIG